jgi:hypothetical protein
MRTLRWASLGGFLLALGTASVTAQSSVAGGQPADQAPVAWATITYLSGQNVYIDAGTAAGLREGTPLEVVRAGAVVANLVIAFVSSTRASCSVERTTVVLAVGDSARFTPPATPAEQVVSLVASTTSSPATARKSRSLHGRLGVRYLAITSAGSSSDLLQPAVDARIEGPVGGSPLGLTLDLRSHRTRLTGAAASKSSTGETRIYQAAMQLQPDGSPARLVAGRQFAAAISPIGLFDGIAADLNFPAWSAGAFGGTQPDPVRFGYSTLVREYGAWVQAHNAPGTPGAWSFTTAAVGSYQNGQINREFVYAQGLLVLSRLSVFASQELDLNRGWKTDAGEPATSPTSTFATVRVSPIDALAIHAGFDNRRSVRLYRDRITPEVEFDDSFRQGVWGGMNVTIGQHLQLVGDLRSSTGGLAGRASSSSASVGLVRLTRLQLGLRARATTYAGETLRGSLQSASVEIHPLGAVRVELTGGVRRDANALAGADPVPLRWFGGDADLSLGRSFYLMLSTQYEARGTERGRHSYSALSWRF